MDIAAYIPYGANHAISRKDLVCITGLNDRAVRAQIQKAREEGFLILNKQNGAGYFLATETDIDELQRQYAQDSARALAILRRRKAIRRILKEAGRPV